MTYKQIASWQSYDPPLEKRPSDSLSRKVVLTASLTMIGVVIVVGIYKERKG